MTQIIDFNKLKDAKLTSKNVPTTKPKKKKQLDISPMYILDISWTELDHNEFEIVRSLRYDPHDEYHALSQLGQETLAEYCLNILGRLAFTNLNLATKIKNTLIESVKEE